jgi:hypothetical protein
VGDGGFEPPKSLTTDLQWVDTSVAMCCVVLDAVAEMLVISMHYSTPGRKNAPIIVTTIF